MCVTPMFIAVYYFVAVLVSWNLRIQLFFYFLLCLFWFLECGHVDTGDLSWLWMNCLQFCVHVYYPVSSLICITCPKQYIQYMSFRWVQAISWGMHVWAAKLIHIIEKTNIVSILWTSTLLEHICLQFFLEQSVGTCIVPREQCIV